MLSGRSEAPLDRKCFPLLTGIADACSAPLGFTLWIKEALMPERETIERARADAREGKHGAASPKQAIAIGLSKARRAGVSAPSALPSKDGPPFRFPAEARKPGRPKNLRTFFVEF